MGCAGILVAILAVLIGMVVLPTTVSIVGLTNVTTITGEWEILDACLALLPFAFLALIILAGIWAFIK